MKILFVASELTPIAKVGGLGDVTGGLSKALEKMGIETRIVIGNYGIVDHKKYHLKKITTIDVPWARAHEKVDVFETTLPHSKIKVYLVSHKLIGGAGVYDSETAFAESDHEIKRFLLISRSALELMRFLKWRPDALHVHDWHTSMVPVWQKTVYKDDPVLKSVPTLLTIHNLANQGIVHENIIKFTGLEGEELPSIKDDLRDHDLNLFRQGIENTDLINTVSPTYAREILTPEYGEKLDQILSRRRHDLFGIVNGIDYEHFNPATDPDIKFRYDHSSFTEKYKNKLALREELNLQSAADKKVPMIGLVSRLTDQKGGELINEIIDEIVKLGCQLVILGLGDPVHEKYYTDAAKKYPQNISANIKFDAPLAQRIYAASDFFLMPSRFEPCGLGQMYAMRYGSVPIVRRTGGLADTVRDGETGFVFEEYSAMALGRAIKKAISVFNNQHDKFIKIATNGMREDFSWRHSAKEYLKLYQRLINE